MSKDDFYFLKKHNKEYKKDVEKDRMKYAIDKISNIFDIQYNDQAIEFVFKGEKVVFWPFTGWHSGKSIKDGRGLNKLLKQIEG